MSQTWFCSGVCCAEVCGLAVSLSPGLASLLVCHGFSPANWISEEMPEGVGGSGQGTPVML